MPPPVTSKLPLEVELAVEVMPCQAMRRSYDSAQTPHPCAYFAEWGFYHSYDYGSAGPPDQPVINLPAVYQGKRNLVPELLSGCRKSPILCVGINPNLPGWTSSSRNAIHPYLDDLLQYAHYFRYRTRDKLRIPDAKYEDLLGTAADTPASARPLKDVGDGIPVEPAHVLMYQQYQTLLDGLATRKNWQNHKLSVGEDIAYANMVACPSARWVVSPNSEDPTMPVMGTARAKGIVKECFYDRRYFLRQLVQSLPAVIIVFSSTTSREFIAVMQTRFSQGDPQPNESLANLFQREIRLRYGALTDGTVMDARVIFMPHASANPNEFAQMRGPCVDRLAEEVDRGHLVLNPSTGHLRRGRGACVFCANALYKIGKCDYEQELQPLAAGVIAPLAADADSVPADKLEQLKLLNAFAPPAPSDLVGAIQPLSAAPPAPPPIVLKGNVVSLEGPPLNNGAVYIRDGRIAAVRRASDPTPAGFEGVPVIDTGGVIYPGLLDLHNHLPYNILPLWKPPRRFDDRSQWQRRAEYRRDVTEPMSVIVGSAQGTIKAIVRYIEVKLLVGGVTSGQGMRSSFGGNQFYRGLVRNFEAPDDPALAQAGSRVLDLTADDVPKMRSSLNTGRPYFFHLAEGLDSVARRQYTLLESNQLLKDNLLCIHSLALQPAQHQKIADAGTHVVWSPLSNSLLYGQTIEPKVLAQAKTIFGLGSDWTPSGSRNILEELKVAWLCSKQAGNVFDVETLVRGVTLTAATAAGWGEQVGSIKEGKLADLVVLDAKVNDPYENLVRGTEREVRLVVVGGLPRYGLSDLMHQSGLPDSGLEKISVGGSERSLFLRQTGSPLAGLTFDTARKRLEAVMADLNAVRNAPAPIFEPLSDEPAMTLELDMQAEEFDLGPRAMADLPPLSSIPLDGITVVDDTGYFDALEAIAHLPDFYKGSHGLRGFYS